MDLTYWHKQTATEPLFPDMLWSRPENRRHAGKLLIIGGNTHGFAAPAQAYQTALKAGVGLCKVLLPDATSKALGSVFEAGEYAPSTPSGSFARTSLASFLERSHWADGVLLAGDLGRNSETAIVLESYLTKTPQAITLTRDAVDYIAASPATVLARPNTTLVLSVAQLQKLAQNAHFPIAFTFEMDLLHMVQALHEFTTTHAVHIIVKHHDTIFVAVNGQVSSTKCKEDQPVWRLHTAAYASVWWLQNSQKTFEALTTSLIN